MEPRYAIRGTWPAAATMLVAALIAAGFCAPAAFDARPRRFAEVIPGRLYRGGYPQPQELRWVVERYGVRSVVCLMKDAPDAPRTVDEQRAVRQLGLRFDEFPMPGDGRGDFDALDGAADAIAGAGDGPVYLHCAAGRQRTNAALAAYRMKHCGWSFERAMSELEQYGLDRDDDAELVAHLRAYWTDRIAGRAKPASSR